MLTALLLAAALPTHADTVTFQAGAGDYGHTDDITLAAVGAEAADAAFLFVDTSDGDHSGAEVRALLRFPDIVGPGEGQIRQGSEIHSAFLTLQVDNAGGELGIHEVLEPWTLDDVDWSQRTADDGWTAQGVDPPSSAPKALSSLEGTRVGTATFSVRIALREWTRDPSRNHGFVLIAQSSDGTDIHSSEAGDPALRPLLTVDYTPSEGDTGLVEDSGEPEDTDAPSDTGEGLGLGNDPGKGNDGGCGCAVGGGATGGWLLVLAGLVGLRRGATAR